MADPYQILGVTREATQEDIRKAYRRLAKMHHPDLHPGDKDAETRFKEIASAYDIIGDDKKRARFDSGEIDATGAERPQQPEREFYRQHAEAGPGFRYERRWGMGRARRTWISSLNYLALAGPRRPGEARTSTTHFLSSSQRQ